MMEGMEKMDLGKGLQCERERHHWTQQELAEKIGYSVPSINRWEHGKSKIKQGAVDQLIKVFGKLPERWGIGYWHVPFLRNPYFTGRDSLLLRLHRTLAADNTVALSQIRAISGLGGIGKTQTALEYAYRYANEYEAVLWVQADSHKTLVSDFAKLSQTLDLQEKEETDQLRMVAAVKRWLKEHRSWLLVLDNADDLAVISDFLPHYISGATLLTTRSQITGMHIKRIEMEKMSQEEGISFLLRRISAYEDDRENAPRRISELELQAAQELWRVMDGLPLALDQVGAYIEASQCRLCDYVDLYRHHREILLRERGEPISEHPDAVATTWSLSFQRVEQKSPAAAELLRLCAFLFPDAIPEELLIKGATHLTASLQALATTSPLLNKAISTLLTYSLIHRDPETRMLSIHRLVQAVLQDRLEEAARQGWGEQVVLAVNAAFPEVEHKNWPQCERLLMQALAATQIIERYQIVSEEAGHLLSKTAFYLRDRGRYSEAELYFQQVLQMREQQRGPEHSDVATALTDLAVLNMYQGKYEQSEPLYLRALHIREQQLEHPAVATLLNGLANLYVHRGSYAQAESLFQRILQMRERQWGLGYLDVAIPLNNLASLYVYQGKYAEAEPLFLQSLHIWEQQEGPNHPNVAYSLSNLGELYLEQEKYAEAEPLFLQSLHIWEQQEGPNHPDVIYPLNGLGNICREQGKYTESESLFLRAVHIREQQLGPEHPDLADLLNGLANLYREQGKYTEAASLYRRALRIREQVLGREHPETAKILYGLAQLQEVQGNREEAKALYARVLAIRKQTFGIQHFKTEEVYKRFIALLQAMGKYEEII